MTRYELTLVKKVDGEQVDKTGVAIRYDEPMEMISDDLFFMHLRVAWRAMLRREIEKHGVDPLNRDDLETYFKFMGTRTTTEPLAVQPVTE